MEHDATDDSIFHQVIDIRKLVYRRQRYDTNCRYVAKHRDNTFQDFSMEQLIPFAFYTVCSDLGKFPSLQVAVTTACQIYEEDKSDLYNDCHKYCKVLKGKHRAVATLECANIFSTQCIQDSDERKIWAVHCRDQLESLKHLILQDSVTNKDEEVHNAHQRKRKREPQHNETNDMNVCTARMARVEEVKDVIGVYLFVGMKTSRIRKQEAILTLTDTVRLELALQEGDDFKLAVWVESSVGHLISRVNSASVEALRDLLGDYLFEGMVASKKRGEESGSAHTGAVVVHQDRDDDCIVEVMLCFLTGKEVYATIYP